MYGKYKEKLLYSIVRRYIKRDIENGIEEINHKLANGLIRNSGYFLLDFNQKYIGYIRIRVDENYSNVRSYTLYINSRKMVVKSDLEESIDKVIDLSWIIVRKVD